MRRLITVLLWVGFIAAVVVLSLSTYKSATRVETQATAKIETEGFSDIWFSPEGQLAALRVKPDALNIRLWAVPSGPALKDTSLAWDAGADPIFAVTQDVSKAAWVHGASI